MTEKSGYHFKIGIKTLRLAEMRLFSNLHGHSTLLLGQNAPVQV